MTTDLNTSKEAEADNIGASLAIERLSAMVDSISASELERRAKRRRRRKKFSMINKYSPDQQYKQSTKRSRLQSKILKFSYILITSLLYNYLSQSNFYHPIMQIGVQASQLAPASKPAEPNQFFLPTDQRSIKLVGGGLQAKSEEEEEGFVMRDLSSPSSLVQNQTDSLAADPGKALASSSDSPNTETPQTATTVDDQRIPIDVNRQQFVTHEQLSLLNANTKDEHINLTSNEDIQPLGSSFIRRTQTPRTGMSKVSHVSSLLSDILAYATRYRPVSSQGDQQSVSAGQRITNSAQSPTTTTTTTSTTTVAPTTTTKPALPVSASTTCPGVCRYFLTAPILCRNEINAPCPTIFQKCCERDDVSFNGTPVETSAPLNPADADTNPAPLSDSLPQVHEQSTLDYQTSISTTPTSSDRQGAQQQQQQQQRQLHQAGNGTASHSATAAAAAGRVSAGSNEESGGDGSVSVSLQQPVGGSIYFLSSGNGSESSPAGDSNAAQSFGRESGELERSGTTKKRPDEQQQVDLAQSAHDRGVPVAAEGRLGKPNAASQSFDSPLVDDAKPSVVVAVSSVTKQGEQQGSAERQAAVLVDTVNGTILHQPSSDHYRRPIYANWTDYHLLKQARPTTGSSVVYHSNTDPVKKLLSPTTITTTSSTPAASEINKKTGRNNPTAPPARDQSGSSARRSGGSDAGKATNLEPHSEVMNDQHSAGGSKPIQPRPQQSPPATTTTTTTTTTTSTTPAPEPEQQAPGLTPKPASSAEQAANEQLEDRQPLKTMGTMFADLLEHWWSGSSSLTPSEQASSGVQEAGSSEAPSAGLEAQSTSQVASFAAPDNGASSQPINEHRLGLDPSFRQQERFNNSSAGGNRMGSIADAGLMTSDGSSEQSDGSETSGVEQADRKCEESNFCIVEMFAPFACDTTYKSTDCGTRLCCVNNPPDSPTSQANQVADQSSASGGSGHLANTGAGVRQQNCREHGECLAVYQSGLCAKPSEFQQDTVGCPPLHGCCFKPSFQTLDSTSHNHIEDGLDAYLAGPSKAHLSVGGSASEVIKDSSLFTALLPPPPPSLSDQQLAQEQQQLGDQFMLASGRQRPSTVMQPLGQESAPSGSIQQPSFYQANSRPAGAIKSGQTGGIMSQIYQMFKPNGPGKQRNRSPAAQQQQQQQQMAPSQNVPSFMSQMFEPYMQPQRPSQSQQQQQQQLVFPIQQNHGVLFGNNYAPASGYSSYPAELETGAKQQQGNRNAFAQHNLQADQQQFMAAPGHVGSNPMAQKSNGQQLLKGVAYGHQPQAQQVLPIVNVQPFGDNSQHQHQQQQQQQQQQKHLGLINQEKFAGQNLEQPPSNGAMAGFAQTVNVNQQQSQQQQTGLAQQQNYVKPVMAGSQQVATAASANKQLNVNPYQIQIQTQTSSNQNERQRFHHTNNNNNNHNAPDNAHNVPFNQAQKNGQHPLPKHSQFAAPGTGAYPGQPLAFGLGAASVFHQQQQQQQQQQQHSPINKLADTSLNRPIGNGAPVGQPFRQATQQQQQYVTANGSSRNGNNAGQELFNMEHQKVFQRQNVVNRVPSSHVGEHIQQANRHYQQDKLANSESLPSYSLSQAPVSRLPVQNVQQQANRLSPIEQQLLMAGQKAGAPEQPIRSHANRAPLSVSINTADAIGTNTKGWSPTDGSQTVSAPMSPSSSNLNVLISSAPYLDQQRLEASGGLIPIDKARSRHQSGSALLAQSRPPMLFSSPVLPAEPQPSNVELSNAPTCPSLCLAPFVDINCAKPNYLDESFTCPTPGTICCVSPSHLNAPNQMSSTKGDPLHLAATSTGTPRPLISMVDSNKLDTLSTSDNDDQLEAANKQPNSAVELPFASGNADQSAQAADSNAGSTLADESASLSALDKNRFQCGLPGPKRRTVSGQARGRVMGGFDSEPGYWCWQAALMNNKNEYLCGGALIGSKWVLTAAHCVTQHLRNETQLFVRLGQHNLNQTQAGQRAKTIQVRTSYVHHNHNGITLDNDIALLRLEEPVNLEEPSICLVCLPERSSQMEPGKRCTVTGYGFETESGPAALRVRQTSLPIVTDQECQNKTSAVLAKPFTLPASSFCAGGEAGQDACHGDGGSPLTCLVNGFYELTGIVSWGYKCGSKDLPGLYSKVSTFVGWINQIVSVNN